VGWSLRKGNEGVLDYDLLTKAVSNGTTTDGYKFYKAANNVILSDGKIGDGIIPPKYFSKVVRSSGEVILPAP